MASQQHRSMVDLSTAKNAHKLTETDLRLQRYQNMVGRSRIKPAKWPGAAFIIEGMLLLAFMAASLAVLVSMYANATLQGNQSDDLMEGIVLASNAAEDFSADPTLGDTAAFQVGAATSATHQDDLVTVVESLPHATAGGVMYYGTVTVWRDADVAFESDEALAAGQFEISENAEPVYTVETARYVSGPAAEQADQASLTYDPQTGTATINGVNTADLAKDGATAEFELFEEAVEEQADQAAAQKEVG